LKKFHLFFVPLGPPIKKPKVRNWFWGPNLEYRGPPPWGLGPLFIGERGWGPLGGKTGVRRVFLENTPRGPPFSQCPPRGTKNLESFFWGWTWGPEKKLSPPPPLMAVGPRQVGPSIRTVSRGPPLPRPSAPVSWAKNLEQNKRSALGPRRGPPPPPPFFWGRPPRGFLPENHLPPPPWNGFSPPPFRPENPQAGTPLNFLRVNFPWGEKKRGVPGGGAPPPPPEKSGLGPGPHTPPRGPG